MNLTPNDQSLFDWLRAFCRRHPEALDPSKRNAGSEAVFAEMEARIIQWDSAGDQTPQAAQQREQLLALLWLQLAQEFGPKPQRSIIWAVDAFLFQNIDAEEADVASALGIDSKAADAAYWLIHDVQDCVIWGMDNHEILSDEDIQRRAAELNIGPQELTDFIDMKKERWNLSPD